MELEHASIQKKETTLPKWILIISGLFALMEILVSVSMCISPESTIENVDHQAKGVDFLIQMWASRQFALGFIFAFATYKKSIPMLTIAYIFLLVMFVGDLFIAITQKENSMIVASLVMCMISSAMIFVLNKRK
ncbi:MAG: hypothetical protein IPH93_15990 [Saprospiraceae bacterium]|nr:hypothetical protein [Saprospiraceae bacterium]MBK7809654.1 hypothetical protein [Saprospiraceae bacterium]MBK9632234.1 hypothetical protein [Saprospiraceae bacterium]